jgi:hypothetical protein
MRQWKKQREFQKDHTQEEDDRRQQLVRLYKDEAMLEHLRYVNIYLCSYAMVLTCVLIITTICQESTPRT